MSNNLDLRPSLEPTKTGGTASNAVNPAPSGGSGFRSVLIFLCVALVGLGGWFLVKHRRVSLESNRTPASGGRGGLGNFPVPVVPGVVVKQDVPIYLDGLGTVQAFNTVTVRSRVDGQVQRVAFVEGQDVAAGDLLAQIDPAPFKAQLDQSIAKKAQDEAQLSVARITLQRDSDLLAGKVLAQQDYDTQKALVDQLVAIVQGDEAAIENSRVQLAYTTISSPLAGRTGIRQVDQGNIVHATDSNGLVVITQLKPIAVVFTLPEQNLGQIQQHLKNGDALVALAVDRDDRTTLGEGKLAVIDNQIDTSTGTIRLKAIFPNDDLRLWPGQFVNVRLRLEIRNACPVVPASVVQRGPQGTFAFVISNDVAVVRPIKVAPQIEAGMALVTEGLEPGERVVVDGQYKLQPGSKVKLPAPSEADSVPSRKIKPEIPAQSKT